MNKDNDEPRFPPGFPEELKAEVTEQWRADKLENDTLQHSIYDFITNLEPEQLKVMIDLLGLFARGNTNFAVVLMGYIEGLSWEREQLCPVCKRNHDAVLHDMIQDAQRRHEGQSGEGTHDDDD